MSNPTNYQTITIDINQEKITKLTQLFFFFFFLLNDYDKSFTSEEDLNSLISQAILPLVQRIEKLEAIIENKPPTNITGEKIAKEKDNQSVIEEANRKYLPRHDVWQILKKTEYINYSGYDHFLNATPNEFENYGIFFDPEKKRYYIKS